MEDNKQQDIYKRRKRYNGKYPKNYNEKYKELNPDKYQDTVEKVISKGMTPVGMHIPIMVKEILTFLDIKENQVGIDATLGYGGHTEEILKIMNHTGHLYALDIDPIEIEKTKNRLSKLGFDEPNIFIRNINFCKMDSVLNEFNQCDFLLADLGVSSMQIDNPSRGFSFKREGALDLRMNPNFGITASDLLMNLNKNEIEEILIQNSDEPYAKEIAQKICEMKSYGPIETTTALYCIIKDVLKQIPRENNQVVIKKTAQRVFQALRIEVNNEFKSLEEFLDIIPLVMKENGKIAILTFHSGEDRLVKKAFKEYYQKGIFSYINDEVIRPTPEECNRNPRASSTKLRVATMGKINN